MGKRGRRASGHHRHADRQPPEHPAEHLAESSATLRGPGEGRADRRRAAKRIKRRRRLSATKEVPLLIGIALVIALFLKTFLVQAFVIPSGSMEQTIRIGDRVLVDKLTPWFGDRPERGDVVVFEDPGGWLGGERQPEPAPLGIKQLKDALTFIGLLPSADEQDLIKRVVAVGGDRIRCCDADGRIMVNGVPLDEPYLYPGNQPSKIEFDVTVPRGRVFVMGDHRGNSADSRYHLDGPGHGTVPEESVVGSAIVVAWPVGHWQRLSENEVFAAVPDRGGPTATAQKAERNRWSGPPTPGELSLVVSVVGLARYRDRRKRSVRSESGGHGRRRAVRSRRSRAEGEGHSAGDERRAATPGGR
ncbi:signal peptidase I [Streptomyces sp. TR06-5]|uniref:signal peptidase I n=1 Tax=unclassified Streptomyces TaxID=2593676 RepID=UPI0039A3F443